MTRNMRDRLKGSTFHQGRCRSPPRECSTVQRDGLALLEENRMGRLGSSSSPSAAGWARARPQGGGCRLREAQRNSLSARTALERERAVSAPPAAPALSPAEIARSSPGRRHTQDTAHHDPGSAFGAAARHARATSVARNRKPDAVPGLRSRLQNVGPLAQRK